MNILSKILLIYCSLAAILIVASLFIGNGNLATYLLLVPLPVYFLLYTPNNLFAKKTDLGLTPKKLVVFLLIFIILALIGLQRVQNPQPTSTIAKFQPVITPTPAPGLITISSTDSQAVNIYKEKSEDSEILGEANSGEVFLYSNYENGWYEITFDAGQNGFLKQ